jgi:phosphotransferase system HPr (HPr) family protein
MGVMLLAASQGCELEMTADGTDEKEAVSEVRQLFESGFGEE